ncbi:MAG TPA: hypothetical protein PLV72_01735 [Candidatus Magasanikbacteria bacterium]|nr:hypothetical protein [Candidatus Magasanikbacteria bacterium]
MRNHRFGFEEFCKALPGALLGSATYPLPMMAKVLRHLPSAVSSGYRVLWRTNSIGPNLKTVIGVAIPAGAIIVPALAIPCAAIYGLPIGAWKVSSKGVKSLFTKIREDLKWIDENLVGSLLPSLRNYEPTPLESGKVPFDISPLRAIVSVLTSAISTTIAAPIETSMFLYYWFPVLGRMYHDILHHEDLPFFLALLALIVIPIGMTIAIPVVALASILGNIGAGTYRSYKKGGDFRHAMVSVWHDIKKLQEQLKAFSTVKDRDRDRY